MDNPILLQVNQLSVTYPAPGTSTTAVDALSLRLKRGESLGIIGESGCGKTSLALALMGLVKQGTVQGEIIYDGQMISGFSDKEWNNLRWKEIALVFQNSQEVLNPVLNIADQVGEPLRIHYSLTKPEADRRVVQLLNMVGLDPDWRHAYPHQLSGGMRQRVLLAMALSCNPQVLIVDEPTTALDEDSRNAIVELLHRLQKQMGLTMIVISHDLEVIRSLTSRVMTMYGGRIVENGLTCDVIRNPMHPYTRGLLNSAPGLFPFKDLWGIEGEVTSAGNGCAFFPRCCQREDRCLATVPPLQTVAIERQVACHRGGIETLLEAEGIYKFYSLGDRVVKAVQGTSIKIRSGEVVALVGESGSGKSTLAHVLAGVFPPQKGQVSFRGQPVERHRATRIMGGMQIVFQDPFSSTSHRFSVLEAVREPLDILHWGNTREKDKQIAQVLQMVQLPVDNDFLSRYCHSLSGGQRQRVAIARALVTNPRLLIADEITSMLDPSTQANLLRQLKGLQNQQGFAMLYITHDLHLARKIADRVYVMQQGQIINSGASFEMLVSQA